MTKSSIGRLTYVHPAARELFYLRLLLCHRTGWRIFPEICTINDVIYPTYRSACDALGLLEDDQEWEITLQEAALTVTPVELRMLLAHILTFCQVSDPVRLWKRTWKSMSEDIPYTSSISLNIPNLHIDDSDLEDYVLYELEGCLNHCSRSLTDFGLRLPHEHLLVVLRNRPLMEEKSYYRRLLSKERDRLLPKLNDRKRYIFTLILDACFNNNQQLVFVYGHGGTCKTFLWKIIIYALLSEGKIVLAVASSGIACLLLPAGRTAHSRAIYRTEGRGRKQNRNKSKSLKIGEIKYKQNITCWNCNQKGHFQNQSLKLVASKGKEVNMAAVDSDDALVCCVENMVKDRIMDSGALFCATYCKEELERFKLRSSKVRLANDKTLDIAGIGDVVLKTSFGTSWTLKDVRYIPGLKRRLISVWQLDDEGYHLGFGDQQWKVIKGSLVVAGRKKHGSMYMVKVHSEGIGAIINGSGSATVWFGEAEEYFLDNVREDKETVKSIVADRFKFCVENGIMMLKMVLETPLQFGVAERLSRTFRAESTRMRVEAPKMLWADSVSTAYLIYRIPYVLVGMRIPEDEWRGKDTSLTHLKVFGCDSFIKVKDVYGEAMKCKFIGKGSNEMRNSFQDTKSHQVIRSRDITFVDSIYGPKSMTDSSSLTKLIQKSQSPGGSSDTSEGSKTVRASRIVEDQMKNTLKKEHPPRKKALRLHKYEDPLESRGL
ncbi:retrovirus-related pol polyprotein from transposon TNT 1-94, partial [Tanacetum coccineum]